LGAGAGRARRGADGARDDIGIGRTGRTRKTDRQMGSDLAPRARAAPHAA